MSEHKLRFRHLLLAAVAGIALVAGACSSDSEGSKSDSSDKSETTDTAKDSDQATDTTGEADNPTSDEGASADFSATVSEALAAIEGSSDPCELYSAVGAISSVGNPETKEQTQQATEFYVAMLNKMADTSSDPALADTLRAGASEFEEYARSVDFDPKKMDLNGDGPDLANSDALDEAMNTYANTEFSNCEIPGVPGPEVTTGQ